MTAKSLVPRGRWARMRAQLALTAPRSISAHLREVFRGRPPLLGRLAGGCRAVRVDRVGGLAGQARQLARVRSEDPVLAELAPGPLRISQRVEAVRIDDERACRVQREVDDQAPGRAVAA